LSLARLVTAPTVLLEAFGLMKTGLYIREKNLHAFWNLSLREMIDHGEQL